MKCISDGNEIFPIETDGTFDRFPKFNFPPAKLSFAKTAKSTASFASPRFPIRPFDEIQLVSPRI